MQLSNDISKIFLINWKVQAKPFTLIWKESKRQKTERKALLNKVYAVTVTVMSYELKLFLVSILS